MAKLVLRKRRVSRLKGHRAEIKTVEAKDAETAIKITAEDPGIVDRGG
jgi:hypothetical protein